MPEKERPAAPTDTLPPTESDHQRMLEIEQQAAERQADETVPGGRYKDNPDGPLVDANGEPVKDDKAKD